MHSPLCYPIPVLDEDELCYMGKVLIVTRTDLSAGWHR